MPVLMVFYAIIFSIIIFLNIVYGLKFKAKWWVLSYEVFSGGFMLLLIYSYWTPRLLDRLNIYFVILFALILATDFFYTLWGDLKKAGIDPEEMSKQVLEVAKAASILMAAPAYITCSLVCMEIIEKTFST